MMDSGTVAASGEPEPGEPTMAVDSVPVPEPESYAAQLYREVVEISTRGRNEPEVLKTAIDRVLNRIVYKHRVLITTAAENRYTKAILYLYEHGATYGGWARIDDLVRPSETCARRLVEYGITPLLDQLRRLLTPFQIHLVDYREDELLGCEVDAPITIHAVVISWELPE
jgi:hypothetical protein